MNDSIPCGFDCDNYLKGGFTPETYYNTTGTNKLDCKLIRSI